MRILCPYFIALVLALSARAQIQIVDSGAAGDQINLSHTYAQNFDSLANTGSGLFPMTLPGWHSGDYGINNTAGGSASFGSNTSNERALGSGGTGSWALSFRNSSSFEISMISITYDGEQWKRGSNNPQVIDTIFFNYKIFDAGTGTIQGTEGVTGWTQVEALYFTSPNASLTSGTNLDGNLAENRTTITASIVGISLASGQELWIRWYTAENAFNDHALATDNVQVSFTAIPEPAASGVLVGLCGLILANRRNRQRGQA